MQPNWYRRDELDQSLILTLYIQPNARQTEVAGTHNGALKIKIAAPPVDSQANIKLLQFLADTFKVGKKQIQLKQGEHARQKVVAILDPNAVPEALLEISTCS